MTNFKVVTNHRGYLQYRAKPRKSDEKSFSAHVEYYHQENVINFSPSLSITDIGISFSKSFAFEDMLPNPYLYFTIE